MKRPERSARIRRTTPGQRVLEEVVQDVDLVLLCRRLPDDGRQDLAPRLGAREWWRKTRGRLPAGLDTCLGQAEGSRGRLHRPRNPRRRCFRRRASRRAVPLPRGVVEWGFRAADVLELLREPRMFARRTSPFLDLRSMRGRMARAAAAGRGHLCGDHGRKSLRAGRGWLGRFRHSEVPAVKLAIDQLVLGKTWSGVAAGMFPSGSRGSSPRGQRRLPPQRQCHLGARQVSRLRL